MSADRYFIDTSVILYSYDNTDPFKRDRAEAWLQWLWEHASGSLSWQVIQEFYWNAVLKFGVQPARIRPHVRMLMEWNPPDVTIGMVERAWFWTDQADLSFWDAMIVAAAERTRCRWLLSEDFQTGCEFGSLTIVNPFDRAPKTDHA